MMIKKIQENNLQFISRSIKWFAFLGGYEEKDPYTEQSKGESNLKMCGNYFVYNLDPRTDEYGIFNPIIYQNYIMFLTILN